MRVVKVSSSERLIRQDELLERVPLCRATIAKMEKQGTFPKRRRLHGNAVGWLENEVVGWVERRLPAGTGDAE